MTSSMTCSRGAFLDHEPAALFWLYALWRVRVGGLGCSDVMSTASSVVVLAAAAEDVVEVEVAFDDPCHDPANERDEGDDQHVAEALEDERETEDCSEEQAELRRAHE